MVHEHLNSCLEATIPRKKLIGFQITISEDLHGEVASMVGKVGEKLVISIPKPKLWSPDTPHLYQVSIFLNLPNNARRNSSVQGLVHVEDLPLVQPI